MQRRRGLENTSGASKSRKQNRVIADVVRRASAATVEPLENRWLLNSIGLNFTGGYTLVPAYSLAPTDTAGSFDPGYNPSGVQQTNWNNLNQGSGSAGAGSGTNGSAANILDSTGATLGTTVTWSSAGTWASATNQPAPGDETLNTGFVNSGGTGTPINVTISNVPYTQYDVYVFTLNDAPRTESTTAYGVTYYGNSPDAHSSVPRPGTTQTEFFIDSDPTTLYAKIPSSSRNISAPTPNGDIVVFHLEGGSTFNFSAVSPGNGYVNGVQIVDTSSDTTTAPETPVLVGTNSTNAAILTWHSAAVGATSQGIAGGYSYIISRGTSAGTETLLTTLSAAPGTTNFSDTTGNPSQTYWYKIIAVSPNGVQSVISNEVTAVQDPNAPPGAVGNFTATTDTTVPSITLTWTPPVSATSGYTLFRSSTGPGGTFSPIATITPGSTTSYVDTFAPGTSGSFLYKIQPTNNGNNGPLSDFVGGGFNIVTAGDGISGYYFNNANEGTWRITPNFQPTGRPTYNPVFARIDPNINITGGGTGNAPPGAPITWNSNGGVGSSFAVEWLGFVQPTTNGVYTFFPRSDDGIELLVQNINTGQYTVLDDQYNNARGPGEDTSVVPFSFIAGQKYGIEVLFRQQGGGWDAELRWQGPGVTKDLVPTSNLYAVPPIASTLTAQANDHVVNLIWGGMAADRELVFRGTSPGTLSQIASLGGSAQSYLDTGLTDNVTYYYKITGQTLTAGGGSVVSQVDTNVASATPNPVGVGTPTLNSAQVNLWNRVSLSWSAVPFAQQYHVFRNTTNSTSGATELTTVTYSNTLAPYQSLSYTDSTVTYGSTYFYFVTAQFGTNISSASTIQPADLQHGVEAHYYTTQFWNSNTENDTGNSPSPLSEQMAGVPLSLDNFNGQTFGGVNTGNNANGFTTPGYHQAQQNGFLNSLDTNWNSGSPVSGIGGTSWSAVFTGKIHNNTSASFTFIANSDDDAWIYVDGQLVADDPNGHGNSDATGPGRTFPTFLLSGDHSVVVFYSQGNGGDVSRLRYSMNGGGISTVSTFNTTANLYWNSFISDKPGQVASAPVPLVDAANGINTVVGQEGQSPLVALSFTNNLTGNGTTNNSTVSFLVERADVVGGVAQEWLQVGTAGLGFDPFAVTTTGTGSHVTAFDATALPGHNYVYRIRAANFDGVGDPSATSATISIPAVPTTFGSIAPGASTGGAEAHFYNDQFWGSPLSRGASSNSKNAITQFGPGAYIDGQAANQNYENGFLSNNGNASPYVGQIPTFDKIHNVSFSVAFTGQIHITRTGTYSFMTNTDDDGFMWLSNGTQQVLVSQDGGGHGTRNASDTPTNITPIVLTAGTNYDFLFVESQGGGGWGFNVFWRPPGVDGNNNPAQAYVKVPNGDPGFNDAQGMFSISNPTVAPTTLTVGNIGNNNRVSLTWSDNNKSEVRYVVERATDSAFTQNVTENQVGMNSGAFTDFLPGVTATTTYFYRVRAENFDYVSPWTTGSQSIVQNAAMPTLSGLGVLQDGSEIHVFWSNNNSPTGSESGTIIQRNVDGGAFSNYFVTQRNISTFTDQAVVPGHSYAYQVATAATTEIRPVATGAVINMTGLNVPASPFTSAVGVNYVDASGNVDRTTGFLTSDAGTLLQMNGGPTITSDGRLRVIDNNNGEARSAWLKAGSGFLGGANSYGGQFDSEFDFTFGGGQSADGITFMLQRNSPTAVGGSGGSFGGNIGNSVGVYFNLWNNVSETGLWLNGSRVQNTTLSATTFGNVFHSSDVFHVQVNYDGNGNMNFSLVDKTQPTKTFTTSYAIDPTQVMLDQNTYVGFTGGTGGANAIGDVLNWWWSPSGQTAPAVITGTSGNDFAYLEASAPGSSTINYWTSATPFTSAPTTTPTGSYNNSTASGVKIHGLGGNDTITVDETNGPVFVPTTKYRVNVLGTAGTFTISVSTTAGTQTTPALPFNDSAADVQAKVAALSNVGAGNVTVTQAASGIAGNNGAPYILTFTPAVAAAVTNVSATGAGGATASAAVSGTTASQLDSVTNAAVAGSVTVNVIGTTGSETFLSDPANARFLFSNATKADGLNFANVGLITYTDNGGSDNITVNGAIPAIVTATGTDTMTVNSGSSAIINETGGSNNLTVASGGTATVNTTGSTSLNASNSGSLSVNAGTGNPTYLITGTGSNSVSLGSGNASVTLNGPGGTSLTPGSGTSSLTINGGVTTMQRSVTPGIRQVNFSTLAVNGTSKFVAQASSATNGDYSKHANRSVLDINSGGLTVAAGATLDMGDNDMILNFTPANEAATMTQVRGLLTSGFDGGSWDTPGINSSTASFDGNFGSGTRALGYADNNDLGYTSFDNVNLGATSNQALIKFTYYGDSDLSGTIDGTDFSLFAAGKAGGGTGWDFGDYDYSGGPPNGTDFSLFAAGLAGYKANGSL